MRPRFWRPKIGFDELKKRMMGLPTTDLEKGVPPPWIQDVTDWALCWALQTRTFSSPWEQGLLEAEKERRDRVYKV
jgi:hypothetical protein